MILEYPFQGRIFQDSVQEQTGEEGGVQSQSKEVKIRWRR